MAVKLRQHKLNRRVRFPARPWEAKYARAVAPKLKAHAERLIRRMASEGVLDKFHAYLMETYHSAESKALEKDFDRKKDKKFFDKLAAKLNAGVKLDDIVEEWTKKIFHAGSKHAFGKLGFDEVWAVDSPAVKQAITDRQNLCKGVGDAQFEKLKDMVRTQMYGLGTSPVSPGFLKELQTIANKSAQYQAESIARTETLSVYGKASYTVYSSNGVDGKEWIWSGSGHPRHAGLSGQVRKIDEPFDNGLLFPGADGPAKEIVQCMCSYAPIIKSAIDPDEVVTR